MQVSLPSTILCDTLRGWVSGLMRKKRGKMRKRAGTWLRDTLVVEMALAMARMADGEQGEAVVVEVLHARLGDALQLGDALELDDHVAQPL
eukprot:6193768-Pleurochrysis_carterae.AAC.2